MPWNSRYFMIFFVVAGLAFADILTRFPSTKSQAILLCTVVIFGLLNLFWKGSAPLANTQVKNSWLIGKKNRIAYQLASQPGALETILFSQKILSDTETVLFLTTGLDNIIYPIMLYNYETKFVFAKLSISNVSIHAPARRGDADAKLTKPCRVSFNPRPRAKGRRAIARHMPA